MADDFSNLLKLKKPVFQSKENIVDIKRPARLKSSKKICFIITKNKNNSWVYDLHAQAQLNKVEQVFH